MKTKLTTLILYLIIAFSTEGFCNLPESKDFWRIVDEKATVHPMNAFSDDVNEIKRHFDQEVKGIINYAEIQWDPAVLDSLWGPGKAYGKNYDPNGDGKLTPDEMVIELKNNAWWYTQPIKDYWDQFPEVVANPWMNNYNKAMFENTADWTWSVMTYERDTSDVIIDSTEFIMEHKPFKFFVEENTMNLDPGIVNMNGTDALLAQNSINIRKEWAGETIADEDKVKFHGVDDYLAFTWPFDFDLSYTNTTLLTGSTSGDPIGSLQWFDGGLLLLRELENQLGLIDRISNCITDNRDQRYIDHAIKEMITQRVFQIAAGYNSNLLFG